MITPTLYLFVGYPGAGKTTVSRVIQERTGAVHIWADQERDRLFGKANLTPEETTALYDQLNEQTSRLLADGRSVIFDTNFNFRKDRQRLRQIASEHGANTVIVWLNTPLDVARHRATRTANGHDTRVWGNMAPADFERISAKLEPPTADEQAIVVDGTQLDDAAVASALNLS